VTQTHSIYVNENGRPVRFWSFVLPLVAAVLSLVLLALAAPWLYALVVQAGASQQDVIEFVHRPEARYVGIQVLLAIGYIVVLIVLRWCLGGVGRARLTADFVPTSGKWIALGAIVGVALAFAALAVMALLSSAGAMDFHTDKGDQAVLPHSVGELLMAASTIVLLGPYVEELYFRGAMLTWLRERIGWLFALALSAAIFGLAHLQFLSNPGPQGWVLTALIGAVGVVNGIWANATRSLWPAFATHAAYNGTMVMLALLVPSVEQ